MVEPDDVAAVCAAHSKLRKAYQEVMEECTTTLPTVKVWRKVVIRVTWASLPPSVQDGLDYFCCFQNQTASVERIFAERARLEKLKGASFQYAYHYT